PYRGLYGIVNAGGPHEKIDYNIPADMYYACLDRTSAPGDGPDWNNDNDDKWGENNEADLLAEFYIARICMNGHSEIANFINKTIMYSETPVVDELQSALLVGELLFLPPPWGPGLTYGGWYMDELIGFCDTNGYTTIGIPTTWNISKLYEEEFNWTSQDLFAELNLGPNLLNHLGHGSPTHCLNIDNSDLTTYHITNDGITHNFINGYSQACYSGSMDNWHWSGYYVGDCFAEKISTMPTATSTFIANSRYGWGQPGGTDGASQIFNREWIDVFFDDGIYSIAGANQVSKEHAIPFIEAEQVVRWCCYELNVFGDPALQLWTEPPTFIDVCYNQFLVIGQQSFDVISYNCSTGRVAIHFNNEIIGVGELLDGSAQVLIFNPPTEPGIATLTILPYNQNYYLYKRELPVINSPFCISGHIYDNTYGYGIPDIKMNVENGMPVRTNSSGYYCIEVAPEWSGTVTPEKGYWKFDPPFKEYANIQNDVTDEDYTGILKEGIAGTITLSGGNGQVQNVKVAAGGQITYPNSQGIYIIPLPPRDTVYVYAYLSGYKPEGAKNVEIIANQIQVIDFTLEEGLGIFVQQGGIGDATTIQEGIELAQDEDTVWVADGIYSSGDNGISLNGRNITIKSIFGHENCIISGNSTKTFRISNGDKSTIDGFTISDFARIKICEMSSSTINSCNISTVYGIHISHYSTSEIRNCQISSSGVGIVSSSGYITITNCEITNCAKALEIGESSKAIIDGCIISNNEVWSGGKPIIDIYESLTTISNCEIVNNIVCGAFCESKTISCTGSSSELNLLNCTLYGNDTQNNDYSIYLNEEASGTITNCILWDDVTEQQICPLSCADVSYCDIKTDYPGLYPDNCIFDDPNFFDPANGNYSLIW
ncbi:MAG: right-handed parallel beta-helix repeat-containing protein, partial [Candidatus Cloacimonetes bacterium]|nr:right-handed parallel beta-helix repeat-containing protein [Candidatus Cloacimonadota bacterium]